jgi:hypothetical protein
MSGKNPIYIFSNFGSKINEFERKKSENPPKVAGNYPNIHSSFSIFLHEKLK